MSRHFEEICGADADGGHADKAYIVSQALERLGVTEDKKVQAVMVGDRMHDVVGGQKNGLTTVGLTMGYGSCEEFAGAGVSYVADSAEEMVAYLLK